MQFTELPSEGLERSFKVIIPSSDIESQIKLELSRLTKTTKLPGFRSGKVPASLVEKKYSTSIRADVLQNAARNSIKAIVQQYKLDIVSTPAIDDVKSESSKDVEFVVKMEIMPQISLPNFREIKLERPQLEITDKELEEQLQKVAEVHQEFTSTTKTTKAKDGDKVVIDFEGFVDGKAFDGGKAEKFELVLGSKSFIDTFEDQLVGVKVGDELVVKVTFPKAYHAANLAGKKAEFNIKVHEVLKSQTPVVDDALAKKCKCENVEELRKKTVDTIKSLYDDEIYGIVKRHLFDQLDAALKFDIPSSMYKREYESLKAQADSMSGEDAELTRADLDKYFEKISRRRIRIGLMLSEYVKKNDIKLEQNDIREAIIKESRSFPGQELMIFDHYQSNPEAVEALSGRVLEDKAVKIIMLKEVLMKDKPYSIATLKKFLDAENEKDVM